MASIKPYQTKKGKFYRVDYVRPDGRNTSKRGFPTKALAQAWADTNAVKLLTGDWIDPGRARTHVSVVAQDWLADTRLLKASTADGYESMWRRSIEPVWGDREVGSITQAEVQRWVSTLDYSGSWVRNLHSVLCQILDIAMRDRMVRDNVARGVKLPRKESSVHVYLTMQQVSDLAAECRHHGEIVWVLATTGLRWGELAALRPMDLDPLHGRIHVRRNAVWLENKREWHFNTTLKNHQRRTIAIPDHVMAMVLEVAKERRRDELIWQARSGTPLHSPGHRTWFAGAVERMVEKTNKEIERARAEGLPEPPAFERITPHGLRHVAAGLLVNAGANVKVVQLQLGHKDAAETLNTYTDLFPDVLEEVRGTMDGILAEVVELRAPSNLRHKPAIHAV